ncbi:fibronectin type III domain-containing protein [Niabella insulamsoli]|uniref:fibronectin type III domain-containing protein n=1 Tax=Niabella insulamsoli TaxID=3144874 RepID=UPI0031FD5285
MTILNLPFSFVQFAPISQTDYILPFFKESDVWFSLIVRGATFAEAQEIFSASDTEMQLLLLSGYDNVPVSVPSQTLRNYTIADGLKFRKYKVSDTDILFVWQHSFTNVVTGGSLIACKECFQLGLLFRGTTMVSNVFKKVCDDVDTTFIQYFSEDNSFQFYYCNTDDFQNRIRIPALIRRPQIVTNQNIYVRSDGTQKVTKSVKSKEFNMLIDFADITLHEKIDMALSHDKVYVENRNYSGSVVGYGNYNIDWEGAINKFMAQGDCKLLVTPYDTKNSNCGVCGDCTAVAILTSSLPNAEASDLTYNEYIELSGSGPFNLSNIVAPAWLTVSLDGNRILLSGSIPQEDGVHDVAFDISNCFGVNTESFASTITVSYIDPPELFINDITSTSADLAWPAEEGATGYEILVRLYINPTESNAKVTLSGYPVIVTGITHGLTGLTSGSLYQVSIRTIVGSSTSDWEIQDFSTL